MMITMAMDSDTPSCQPFRTMIATTLITMKKTALIAYRATRMFLVAMSRIKKARAPEIEAPVYTPLKKANSDCIHGQKMSASW